MGGVIKPSAVVGHSSGEIAAAYAAGLLSLEEALLTAYYRGYVTKEQPQGEAKHNKGQSTEEKEGEKGGGGMAAVSLSVNEATAYLKPGVVIACDNSPRSVTLSGDVGGPLESVLDAIKADKPDTFARRLKVDMAYHSHRMRPLAGRYQALLEGELRARSNTTGTTTVDNDGENNLDESERRVNIPIPMYSTVAPSSSLSKKDHDHQEVRAITPDSNNNTKPTLDPNYWVTNLTSRVEFTSAILRILKDQGPNTLFIEIGPHSTLSGPSDKSSLRLLLLAPSPPLRSVAMSQP